MGARVSKVSGISNVTFAVKDIDEALPFFEQFLGMPVDERVVIEQDGYDNALFYLNGVTIELLAPLNERSPVARFLARRGPGLYHVGFLVDDFDAGLREREEAGLRFASQREYDESQGRWREAYTSPRDAFGAILALVERHGTSARQS